MRHDWNVMMFTGFVPQHSTTNSLSLIRILIKIFSCSGGNRTGTLIQTGDIKKYKKEKIQELPS